MGKIIPIIVAISLVLCGCGDNKQAVAVPGYTCQAQIEYDKELSTTAHINVPGGGIFEARLTSPSELNGLSFSVDRENVVIRLKGLEEPLNLPESYGGFVEIMAAAFLKLSTGSPTLTNEKLLVFEGTAKGFFFKFTLNQEGLPLSLNIPEKNLEIEFSKWQYKSEN